jgi:hypothetical protein
VCWMFCSSNHFWCEHHNSPNNTRWEEQIPKLLTMQFFLFPYFLISLGSVFSPLHSFLKHLLFLFHLQSNRPVFITVANNFKALYTVCQCQQLMQYNSITGYSLRTLRHRYTEWVLFDRENFKPDWKYVIARELYDHQLDPAENMNIADRSFMSETVQILSKQLQAGWRYSLPKHILTQNN